MEKFLFTSLFLFFLLIVPSIVESLQVSNLSSIETMRPGEKKQVTIQLINDRDVSEKVSLKLVDYACNSQGEHFFNELTDNALRSNASWIRLGQEFITLAPRETRDIYYIIEVPAENLLLRGSYWSVLLIEPLDVLSSTRSTEEGLHLCIKIRYAHHIVTNVGGGTPKISVLKKEIQKIEGKRYLRFHVVNEGELFLNPSLTLKLYNKKGELERSFKTQPERLYPGNPQCFLVDINNISEEWMQEKLTGFFLFEGKDNYLFGDRFVYP
jgi:hypothetical protein